MKSYAVIIEKGGCGKTSTAVNLAYSLSSWGQSVCLIDFDPQANATTHVGVKKGSLTSYHFLRIPDKDNEHTLDDIVQTVHGFDFIPSSKKITKLDKEMADEMGKFNLLKDTFEYHKMADRYQYVIIDCPTLPGYINNIAMVACDLIIPVECKFLAVKALKETLETLGVIKKNVPGVTSDLAGVLPTFLNKSKKEGKDCLKLMREHYGDKVFSPIRDNTVVSNAVSFGVPLELHNPRCPGAQDYRLFSNEVLRLDSEL